MKRDEAAMAAAEAEAKFVVQVRYAISKTNADCPHTNIVLLYTRLFLRYYQCAACGDGMSVIEHEAD